MIFRPARRMDRLPPQFFAGLVARAQARAAAGRPVINLGQGNPDLPTPAFIVDALLEAGPDPRFHRYIGFRGLEALKEAAAGWYRRRFGVELDPVREVAILIGTKVGLQELSLTLLNPGDRAVVPDPGYPDYWSGIALAGGEMVPWPLSPAHGFLPRLEDLAAGARLVFVNSPQNPTGRVLPPDFYRALVERARSEGFAVAHDIAYADLVFRGEAVSLLAVPGGKEVGIEFFTLSKSYNMAGWRIGIAAGNPGLIALLETLQDHLHTSHFGAVQMAAAAALNSDGREVAELREIYRRRLTAFLGAAAAAGWDIPAPEGSFFVWAPVPAGAGASAWADRFLEEADVVVAPGPGFGPGGEGYVRVSLTAPEAALAEAGRRLGQVVARA